MVNISVAIRSAAERLSIAGVPEPRREASLLLRYAIGKDTAFIIAHPEYELSSEESAKFETAVRRREQREPFQLILGSQEFYGLDFQVQAGVLIPRPETEILVERAIEILRRADRPTTFLEIGVGTGCISVSILDSVKTATATAVEISEQALALAARNSHRLGVSERLELLRSDLFQAVPDRTFDVIVSNPPYVPLPERPKLQREVVDFDPPIALFAGEDGLDAIRRIAAEAPRYLVRGGYLLVEIGHGQSESVKELFETDEWQDVEFLNDLQGIERTAAVRRAF